MMEGLAGGAGMDAAVTVEAEQRRIGPGSRAAGRAAPGLLCDEPGDARPVRDEAALAEFSAAHDEQAPTGVDVAKAQSACLAGAQSEPVTQGEDGAVDRAPLPGPGVVWQRGRGLQQPARMGGVEQER